MPVSDQTNQEVSPELLRAMQLKGLEMLLYFQKFCEEHGLLFYFCGGCCIGTLRHGGFIPWDDDVDVFMPRADYERLKELWNKHADTQRYACVYPSRDLCDHNLFVTIRDTSTTFIKPYQQDLDIPHGLMMDVFPLDAYPLSKWQRRLQVMWALLYSLFCAQVIPEKHGKVMRLLSRIALALVPFKSWRYAIWRLAERQMSKYKLEDTDSITELCAGPGYMKNRYPKEAFASAVYKEFEGHLLPIPVGYDAYLRIAFGDYMQLPPAEKQKPQHDAVLVDLEHGYARYKGQYYCKNENKTK